MNRDKTKATNLMTPSNILAVIALVMIIAVIAVAAVIHRNASTRTTSDVNASDQQLQAPLPTHIPADGIFKNADVTDTHSRTTE